MIDRIGGGFKDYVPVALRLGLAAIFIVRGAFSLTGLYGSPSTQSVIIAVVEILGGLFCLIGFMTRWAAFALCVLIIYRIVEGPQWRAFLRPEQYPFLAYLIMAFALYGVGGGKWSVDEGKKKKD
ncbi:MAG TPA: DoxX family protein [Planctomycetota bacterium]